MLRSLLVLVVFATWTTAARAEVPLSTWSLRFEPGAVLVPYHLRSNQESTPYYFGLATDGAIVGPVRASVSLGGSAWVGFLAGASLRYAVVEDERLVWSIGAGPLLAPDGGFGWGTFAQIDTGLQFTSRRGFLAFAGAATGIALNHNEGWGCNGTSVGPGSSPTPCVLSRGDLLLSLRLGVGVTFPRRP